MSNLQNKIDFVVIIKARNANPNGDPLNGNRPRTTYTGQGEISDVCIKRKIRNRLQDMGENIFVQSRERADDGYNSLEERAKKTIPAKAPEDEYKEIACKTWIDVRAFGQVFAFGDNNDSVSVGVRGPVSIRQAQSCSPVDINSMQITKSVNGKTTKGNTKGKDTMGTKHFVEFGLYRIMGSINVQMAEKTGFSEEDAEKIKESLRTLFVNDSSAARPDGSMEVVKVFWWVHDNKIGQYSAAKVHNSIKITLKDGVEAPTDVSDYNIELEELPGLVPEIIEGI